MEEEKLESAMDAFDKLEVVEEGTNGNVYKAILKETREVVALKITFLHEDGEVVHTTLSEISLHRLLSLHPHVVRLIDVKLGQNKEGKRFFCLVFEYMDTDLKKWIQSFSDTGRFIPSPTIKSLMYQLCKGVASCHGRGVIHRDLKPPNLLMDSNTMTLKIANLKHALSAVTLTKKRTHENSTLSYLAPEHLLGSTPYSTGLDMWSVGCIFAELVTQRALFPEEVSEQELLLLQIFRLLGTPDETVLPGVTKLKGWHEYPKWSPKGLSSAVPGLDEEGLDLLSKMLQYEPSKRISAKRAMEHPYFNGLDIASD